MINKYAVRPWWSVVDCPPAAALLPPLQRVFSRGHLLASRTDSVSSLASSGTASPPEDVWPGDPQAIGSVRRPCKRIGVRPWSRSQSLKEGSCGRRRRLRSACGDVTPMTSARCSGLRSACGDVTPLSSSSPMTSARCSGLRSACGDVTPLPPSSPMMSARCSGLRGASARRLAASIECISELGDGHSDGGATARRTLSLKLRRPLSMQQRHKVDALGFVRLLIFFFKSHTL